MSFGAFVRQLRLTAGLSLREFCNRAQLDPSNWSKIERERSPLTMDRDKLEELAALVGLTKNTPDWTKFFDLAYIAQKEIPKEVYEDKEVLSALPVFFRMGMGQKPTEDEMKNIIEILKRR